MPYQMRAMSFAELLDTSFRIVRDHFATLVGLTACVYIPVAIINSRLQPAPGQIVWTRFALSIGLLLTVWPLVSIALTHAIGEIYLGRTATIGGSLRRALSLIIPLTGTMILLYLGVLVGLLLLVIPGIYLLLAWMLVWPVVVLERVYGPRALGRSRTLMQGNMLRGFGVVFLASLLASILGSVLSVVFGLVPVLGPLGEGIAQSVSAAYSSVVLVLLYFDSRCRKEAFDLEHLAQLVEARSAQAA